MVVGPHQCIELDTKGLNEHFTVAVSVPVADVMGVLGKKVLMQCDVSTKGGNDNVYMVLWFKESGGEPIYR